MEAESTREKIKAAAAEEFTEKGLDGARMQAIADRAGANKAMIYYYFHSKEALFEAIIRETFAELFHMFSEIKPDRDLDPAKLVPRIVHIHMQFLLEHPYIPKIMVRELHSGHPIAEKVLKEMFGNMKRDRFPDLVKVFEAGARAGKIRKVDPLQTLWSIVALNIFYFVARPFLNAGWPELFSKKTERRILEAREKAVADLILHGLLPK
jgi:TetR/AcrR family transcriptional regulator